MREVFISLCLEFPNIPDDFLRTSEHCRKFQKKFQRPLNDDILVCCGKVKCIFGFRNTVLNLIFVISHVLYNNSSRFVSQAWELVLDA